jgi:long-chain acyl-CoA synthetase
VTEIDRGAGGAVAPAPDPRLASLRLETVAAAHARCRPQAPATAEGSRSRTWADLAARGAQAAAALARSGVGPGDRVLWLGQGSDRVLELLLGCARRRAVLCPANWRLAPPEVASVVDDLRPALVFAQAEEVGGRVEAGLAAAAWRAPVVTHDAGDGFEAWLAGAPGAPASPTPTEPGPADEAVLAFHIAGHDGRPAAALLSHRALLAQALLMGPWMGVDARSRFLAAGPLFHVGVWMELLATFVAGGANVFLRRFEPEAVCRAVEAHRCTSGYLFGPMIDGIVEANAGGRFDLSSLRGRRGHPVFDAWVADDPSPWGRRPGGYGQTELCGMATFNLLAEPGEAGTHGRPSPLLDLRVVDADGRELPAGETGEVVARGLTVTNGYWDRPELNRARTAGGWWHTRDLGRFEPDGTFSFVGPVTRMLKTGAENVYPAEVEAVLRAHPGVADAVVLGVPDDRWVQRVEAVIEPAGEVPVAAELDAHCRARLAGYKVPRAYHAVDRLPRAADGSPDRDELDRRYGGGGYPGGTTRSV